MKIEFKKNELLLIGDVIDLKIDSKRYVHCKKHDDRHYHQSQVRLPYGLSRYEKEKRLVEYYTLIMDSYDLDEESEKSDGGEEKDVSR